LTKNYRGYNYALSSGKDSTDDGDTPVNVSENTLAIATAGFAKPVNDVT